MINYFVKILIGPSVLQDINKFRIKNVIDMRFLRKIKNKTKRDKVRNKTIRDKLEVPTFNTETNIRKSARIVWT